MSSDKLQELEVVNIVGNRESLETALSRLQAQAILLAETLSASDLSSDLKQVCQTLSQVEQAMQEPNLTKQTMSGLADQLKAANLGLFMLNEGVSINPDAIPSSGSRPDMFQALLGRLQVASEAVDEGAHADDLGVFDVNAGAGSSFNGD